MRRLLAFVLALAVLTIVAFFSYAKADERALRAKFFKDAKSAQLVNGTTQDCCGVGDAMRVKVLGRAGNGYAVEVVDPMRHPTAKKGAYIIVPAGKVAKWPVVPQGMGVILFAAPWRMRRPFCLMFPPGG